MVVPSGSVAHTTRRMDTYTLLHTKPIEPFIFTEPISIKPETLWK
jgi:hypothetical protein